MARIRTIKPGFFKHEALYDLEAETGLPVRLAFAGLWTVADRQGRFEWKPRTLKTDVLPHDPVDFTRVLEVLAEGGFILRYEAGGKTYGCIPSWSRHQVVNNRESASLLPAPPGEPGGSGTTDVSSTREPRVEHARDTRHMHAPVEGKGREEEEEDASPPIEPSMVARAVLEELALSGNELLYTLTDVCRLEMKQGTEVEALRDRLVQQHRLWTAAKPKLQITWGAVKFFGEGHWRDADLWPWKEGHAPLKAPDRSRYVNGKRWE